MSQLETGIIALPLRDEMANVAKSGARLVIGVAKASRGLGSNGEPSSRSGASGGSHGTSQLHRSGASATTLIVASRRATLDLTC